jgi:hypothetical protein
VPNFGDDEQGREQASSYRRSCYNRHLATMSEDRIERLLGSLSAALMQKIDACLKAALGLP